MHLMPERPAPQAYAHRDRARHGSDSKRPDWAATDRLSMNGRARATGFVVASGLLVLIAFARGWQMVEGLDWPFDPDQFRNIANAVTFKDGGVLSDAHYSGVTAWYSPLTSALFGLGSLITSIPVNRLEVQGGAVLNLVTPVALCWTTARWFGRRAALLTLVGYLSVIGQGYPSWAIASYAPWTFVNIYAAGLFLLALAAVPGAVNRGSIRDAVVLGIATGVVILAHPAVAVLLAAVVAVQFAAAGWRASRPALGRLARSAAIALATALVVSAPFWLPIMIRYRWHVANHAPGTATWPELSGHNIWKFLSGFVWRWPIVVIAIGLPLWIVHRWRQRTRRPGPLHVDGTSILITWTVLSFLGLLMEVYRDGTPVPIPETPSYHYLFALSVALCIWFGVALDALVHTGLGRLDQRWGALAVAAVVVVISVFTVPDWRNRPDLVESRAAAQRTQSQFQGFGVVDWIRANTRRGDVFVNIGSGDGSWMWEWVLLPGLAGRKSINMTLPWFSNPFVDYDERQDDADRIVRALQFCDLGRFARVARPYGRVRYIITNPGADVVSACPGTVPTVYSDKAVSIQRIVV
jgi:hypothetical protein